MRGTTGTGVLSLREMCSSRLAFREAKNTREFDSYIKEKSLRALI
jgi:hypothetical protein